MSVKPSVVLAARRGFLQSFVFGGFGTFRDNDEEVAASFFDDIAESDGWTNEFYKTYARMDPWRDDSEQEA